MRAQDIKIGELYRHKDSPNYCYAEPLAVIKPKTGVNKNGYAVFKCKWSTWPFDDFGLIKYFRASDLVRGSK